MMKPTNRFHSANKDRWEAASEHWRRAADSRGLWRRCPTEPELVLSDKELHYLNGIAGRRVCVTAGSTSVDILEAINKRFAGQDRKPVVIVLGDARTDCLLQVQEGMVDAYLGHDTFLTGMSESNPALRTVPQGQQQPYGIAIGSANTYFVRYVNAVLAELRQSGELQTWLDSTPLGKGVPPVGDTRPLP